MRRTTLRGGTALALAAIAAVGLLQLDAGEAVAKKKKLHWWGSFARDPAKIFEPTPGYTWDVNYTLKVRKKTRRWSIDDAVGRLNCYDGSTSEGTVTPTDEYFEFAIPPIAGKVVVWKGAKEVFDKASNGTIVMIASNFTGQTPTGRGFILNVGYRQMEFPSQGRWRVEWFIQWQCEGGATVKGVRIIPTYAARQ